MKTITRDSQNFYKTKNFFLVDPFASIYQNSKEETLQNESIENLINYAWSLEENIPGDFDLQTIVTEIKTQVLSFVRTGLLAYKVKIFKLYRGVHKNFKTFCEEVLGISHWQINRKIEAARVVVELIQAGFSILPSCEAQARPLTKLYGAELCNKWKMVVDSLKPHTITSNKINEVLGVESKTASLRLPKKLYEQIRRKALEMELSVEQLLNMMFEDDEKIDIVKEEALVKWEEDLKTLVDSRTQNIQICEENTPTNIFPDKNEFSPIIIKSKQITLKTFDKIDNLKNSNLEHNNLTSFSKLLKQKDQVIQAKKLKNKKPLFEVLNLDKKNLLTSKKIKNPIKQDDMISDHDILKIDELD
ncbi:MAG: hypothetical protein KPI85_09230 (plasmid) [cyanobacterium endosymbiont of Epithemia adnata isolate EadnSB Bon19]